VLNKHEEYLDILPLTQVVKERIEEVINLNSKLLGVEFLDIFICDLKNNEGAKNYTSLWLISTEYLIECKSFLSNNNFDLVRYKNKVGYCSIQPIEYDFETVSEKSSVLIHCNIGGSSSMGSVSCSLIATEENCTKALEIYQKYLITNIMK